MIRVGNVLEDGRFGGPHNRIINVAGVAAGLFETVFLVPKKDSDRTRDRSAEQQVNCVSYSSHALGFSWKRVSLYLLYFVHDIASLMKALKKNQCQIVHVSGGVASFRSVIAGYLAGLPVLWHLNDTRMHSIVVLCAGLFKHLPVCYIYAAHATKEKYSRLGFSTRNDFVIPAPVDYRIKWSNKFGKGPRLRVGLLGNINPNKGQIRLVELAELADREGCDIEFVFAGFVQESQQGYFDSVINTINIKKLKNIKYIGGLNDVNTFFERVDVSLCLSQYESSPQSVWESLAAGRIVISTMVGDVVKVINSGENGYLINLDEPEKILTLLSLVQKMPDKQRKKISLNAQNSLGPFSLMNVSEIHLKAYEFAVDHKNFRTGVGL